MTPEARGPFDETYEQQTFQVGFAENVGGAAVAAAETRVGSVVESPVNMYGGYAAAQAEAAREQAAVEAEPREQEKIPSKEGNFSWLGDWFWNQTFDEDVDCDVQEIRELLDQDGEEAAS